MYKIIEPILGTEIEYSTIEEFVYDVITDDEIEEDINNSYEPIVLPLEAGEFKCGTVIRKMADGFTWRGIKADYVDYYVETIEDELDFLGSAEFNRYIIKEVE